MIFERLIPSKITFYPFIQKLRRHPKICTKVSSIFKVFFFSILTGILTHASSSWTMGKIRQFIIKFQNNKAVFEAGGSLKGCVKLDLAERSTVDGELNYLYTDLCFMVCSHHIKYLSWTSFLVCNNSFQNVVMILGPEISLGNWSKVETPSLPSLIKEPPSGNQPILDLANSPEVAE